MLKRTIYFIALFLCVLPSLLASPYYIRKIDSRDGLSNSAVLSMYQDKEGFLWIGTYSGLNRYDGKFIQTFSLSDNNDSIQSSNIIENIQGAGDNCLWLSTYIGLNKFSKTERRIVEFYPNYRFPFNLASNDKGLTTLVAKEGFISIYNEHLKAFIDIPGPKIAPADVVRSFIDPSNCLWVITKSDYSYKIDFDFSDNSDSAIPSINVKKLKLSDNNIISAFEEKGLIYTVNEAGDLYVYDTSRETAIFIRNINDLLERYGQITSIVNYKNDFIISFSSNGLLQLVTSNKYEEELLTTNVGVFCLLKDIHEDFVWIGFDGKGLGMFNNTAPIFNTLLSSSLPKPISKPVRCLYTDKNKTLWIGTKGDGLILVDDYDQANDGRIQNAKARYYTTEDGLSDNKVFVILASTFNPVIWLGTEGPGLSYYSLKDERIRTMQNQTDIPILRVHSIAEQNDSTLWISTSGHGLLKAIIEKHNGSFRVKKVSTYLFEHNKKIVNDLFAMYNDDNKYLYVCSRGDGVIRFEVEDESYEFINSGKQFYTSTDDIITYCSSNSSHFYFGSCAGLLKLGEQGTKLLEIPSTTTIGIEEMIHGMQEDKNGYIWLATNRGIEKYNPYNNLFYKYLNHTGLDVIEFSDNADYTCPYTDRIFFGGVDGIVWIEPHLTELQSVEKPIYFTGIKLNGVNRDLNQFVKADKAGKYLELNAEQSSFSVLFVAVNYMYGMDMQYAYRLKNYNEDWIASNSKNEASFTNLPHGHYSLEVKYRNDVFESESPLSSLQIVVLPPWYLTTFAKILYGLAIIILIAYIVYRIRKKALERLEDLNKQVIEKNMEELYQSKMKFFSNVTHEFLTPLTLMQGPCERILSYENTDEYVKRYTEILNSNTTKLTELVNEIISFSRDEEETSSAYTSVKEINIQEFIDSIYKSFSDTIERKKIDFEIDIQDKKLCWCTSQSHLNKIYTNLISNAFKYTPDGGSIKITAYVENELLVLSVYNTGLGLTKAEISKVFDRYTILNNMDENITKDFSSRNGLGLAICYAAIHHLKGSVEVKSEKNVYAEFIAKLPSMKADLNENLVSGSPLPQEEIAMQLEKSAVKQTVNNEKKQRIIIVDDNKDIVNMLAEALDESYETFKAFNTVQALNILKNILPDLIITDLIMPGENDGMYLVKKLKSDVLTRHIPVIIISAKNNIEDQMKGIEHGADFYLTKPFRLEYLKSIIEQLMKKEVILKEYHTSPMSVMEMDSGRLVHQEDHDFIMKATNFLDKNIENGDIKPDMIAETMNISPQAFYRRVKSITSVSARTFIKKYRFAVAAKLLITTNSSIQEIMYKVGINNRSYFYREFSSLYNEKPKDFRKLNKDNIQKKQDSLLKLP